MKGDVSPPSLHQILKFSKSKIQTPSIFIFLSHTLLFVVSSQSIVASLSLASRLSLFSNHC